MKDSFLSLSDSKESFMAVGPDGYTMLESMAGVSGERDALTRYSRPLTGAYYFVPALDDLAKVSIAT